MRLIAEDLSGERGGETVFSGVGFALGDGRGADRHRAERLGQIDAAADRRRAAAAQPAAALRLRRRRRGFPTVASACHYLGHLNAMKTALTVAENLAFWRRFLRRAAA